MAVKMTCPSCQTKFDCPRDHGEHECFACDYKRQMESGAERFAPLRYPLERLLETPLSVSQTGGMILCLEVPLPRGFYAWFSEFDRVGDDDPEGLAGFGVYYWDEATESDGGGARWVPTDVPYDAGHGRAIAEWAAPLLSAVAAEAASGLAIDQMSVGEYRAL